MDADFLDAHYRHWNDAQILFQQGRWANADHLYGMAVECGLKRLMVMFGMPYDTTKDRPRDKQDQVHARGVWERFESYRSGRTEGADYALPSPNPFQNWDVSDRYAHQSKFDCTWTKPHQAAAETVNRMIRKAQKAGWL